MPDTPALTQAGLTAPRGRDYVDTVRGRYLALIDQQVAFDYDTVEGVYTAILAERLGLCSEALQAFYDGQRRSNATGTHLTTLGALVGVDRTDATFSTVALVLAGTPGTPIPAGSQAEGGGEGDAARWEVRNGVTVSAGGSVTVTARCTEAGEVVAMPGEVDTIVTPVAGWATVTNPAVASVGEPAELDSGYRPRQRSELRDSDPPSAVTILEALGALAYLDDVVVIENNQHVAQVVSGIALDPNSIGVLVRTEPLTVAQIAEIHRIIYDLKAGATDTYGSVSGVVSRDDGTIATVSFDYVVEVGVVVVCTITTETGYLLGDVDAALEEAVTVYFAGLAVGEPVTLLDIYEVAAGVEGIATCLVTLNGAGATVTPTAAEVAVLTSVTVTT